MAEIKLPIKIDGFKCVEDMVQTVLNYTYKGKTLKEWVDSISEPKTNADRIRSMSDEELAEHVLAIKATKDYCSGDCNCLVQKDKTCYKCRLEWLRKEADE